MILEHFGELSTNQALTDGAADSENVIDLGAVANVGFGPLWLSIMTTVARGASHGTSSTYHFDLVVAAETTLDTIRSVIKIEIANDVADPRITALDRFIADCEIGRHVANVADATYRYLGLINTLANGNGTATLSIDAAIAPSPARTKDNVQVIRSNVTIPS